MIIQTLEGFKTHYQTFSEHDQDSIDILISNMLTNSLILKSLGVDMDNHFVQLPLKNKKIIQFIINTDTDSLLVALYDSV